MRMYEATEVAWFPLQWLFTVLVYERYIQNIIQDFVDICSLANISVFILVLQNYGFYVHGR
jgi:meckelin